MVIYPEELLHLHFLFSTPKVTPDILSIVET
jgi:hypothetical protein